MGVIGINKIKDFKTTTIMLGSIKEFRMDNQGYLIILVALMGLSSMDHK